jgi:hypothetical protein
MSAFDWNHYLTLAQELGKRPDDASKRTAISRAYYAVFNTASNRPTVLAYTFTKGEGSHERVWSLYGRNTNQECRDIARIAGRLKGKRVRADYKPNDRICDELPGVLSDAKTCTSLLKALDPKYPEHK